MSSSETLARVQLGYVEAPNPAYLKNRERRLPWKGDVSVI